MSILVDKNTRLICQGITGKAGTFHAEQCKAYGTNLVGGVTPGRGGQTAVDVPVFDTCSQGRDANGRERDDDLRAAPRARPTRSWRPRTPESLSSSPSPRGFRSWTWPARSPF